MFASKKELNELKKEVETLKLSVDDWYEKPTLHDYSRAIESLTALLKSDVNTSHGDFRVKVEQKIQELIEKMNG